MSDLKEYIVTLKRFEDLDDFYEDMETPGGALYIPDRRIDVAVRRPISRNTHYYLTDEEALLIKQDPRVADVDDRPLYVESGPAWIQKNETYTGGLVQRDSDKSISWGVDRTINDINSALYSVGKTSSEVRLDIEGENVDLIIADGHIDPYHPEFQKNSDGTGGSRLIMYDWFSISQQVEGYRRSGTYDYSLGSVGSRTHGMHCAGSAAGNRQGFARKSNLYNIHCYGNDGPFGSVAAQRYLDYIRYWHNNIKTVNPTTGRKNPTIVANSWGYYTNRTYDVIESITIRGKTYINDGTWDENSFNGWLDARLSYTDSSRNGLQIPFYSESLNADVVACLEDGIILVSAAMNQSQYADVPGGPDYDNYIKFTYSSFPQYYNRGNGLTYNTNVIAVGALDYQRKNSKYRSAIFSCRGPRVDIYAPGVGILAPFARDMPEAEPGHNFTTDYRNTNHYIGRYQGTSMASPHVSGIIACAAQLHPEYTQAQWKDYVLQDVNTGIVDRPGDFSYRDPGNNAGVLVAPAEIRISGDAPPPTPDPDPPSGDCPTSYDDITVIGSTTGAAVWGSNPYTDDSDFNVAAVHAGLVEPGQSAIITLTPAGYRSDYISSTKNGVTTEAYSSPWCGVTIALAANQPPPTPVTPIITGQVSQTVINNRDVISLFVTGPTDGVYSYTASVSGAEFDTDNGASPSGTLIRPTGNRVDFHLKTPHTQAVVSLTISREGYKSFTYDIGIGSRDELGNTTLPSIDGKLLGPTVTTLKQDQVDLQILGPTTGDYNYKVTASNGAIFDLVSGNLNEGTLKLPTPYRAAINLKNPHPATVINATISRAGHTDFVQSVTINARDDNGNPIAPPPITATYNLTASSTSHEEGSAIDFTLTTTGVPDQTILYYLVFSLEGTVDSADFLEPLSSGIVVTGNLASFRLTPSLDKKTENLEKYLVYIGTDSLVTNVVAQSDIISLEDTSLAEEYDVIIDSTRIDEGIAVNFYITGRNVPDNLTLYWTTHSILGVISSSDFSDSLTQGSVILNSEGRASVTRSLKLDRFTEGTESFQIRFRKGGFLGDVIATSPTVSVNDISKTPTFSVTPSTNKVNEGDLIRFDIAAENIDNNTRVFFKINPISASIDSNDFEDLLTGSLILTTGGGIGNAEAFFIRTVSKDFKTEDTESFNVRLYTGSLDGTLVATSSAVEILDTSKAPTYSISPTKSSYSEGEIAKFNVLTANVPDGETLYWTTSGGVDSADFVDTVTTGIVVIENNSGVIERPIRSDFLTENPELFSIHLRTGSLDGPIVASSIDVEITDSSLTSNYVLSVINAVTDEGTSVTFTLTVGGGGLPDGTLVPWKISGTNITTTDFTNLSQLTGNFNVNNNTASLTVNISNDVTTEGNELMFLSLTGEGRSEIIGVQIRDSSKAPVTFDPVKIYIETTSATITEGQKVWFLIRAENLTQDVIVPYKLLGISSDSYSVPGIEQGDVLIKAEPFKLELQLGPLSFYSPDELYNGFLEVGVIEDFRTTGTRSIFLNLFPDFQYILVVTSTITILDTSVDQSPRYSLTTNKERVFEGSNVIITLNTTNVPDGKEVQLEILPGPGSDITIADFSGISDLSNVMLPPLVNSTANIKLEIADDFLFEPSEYFYVAVPNTSAATPLIEIIDSGNTLLVSDAEFTGNVILSFLDKAQLSANVGGLSIGDSGWEDNTGKLSEGMYIQGKTAFATESSLAYYQPFSYVIRSNKSIELWRNSIKDILHPAGMALFSEIDTETELFDIKTLESNIIEESTIEDFFAISADTTRFKTSNTKYSNSRFEIDIKTDFAYYINDKL